MWQSQNLKKNCNYNISISTPNNNWCTEISRLISRASRRCKMEIFNWPNARESFFVVVVVSYRDPEDKRIFKNRSYAQITASVSNASMQTWLILFSLVKKLNRSWSFFRYIFAFKIVINIAACGDIFVTLWRITKKKEIYLPSKMSTLFALIH